MWEELGKEGIGGSEKQSLSKLPKELCRLTSWTWQGHPGSRSGCFWVGLLGENMEGSVETSVSRIVLGSVGLLRGLGNVLGSRVRSQEAELEQATEHFCGCSSLIVSNCSDLLLHFCLPNFMPVLDWQKQWPNPYEEEDWETWLLTATKWTKPSLAWKGRKYKKRWFCFSGGPLRKLQGKSCSTETVAVQRPKGCNPRDTWKG